MSCETCKNYEPYFKRKKCKTDAELATQIHDIIWNYMNSETRPEGLLALAFQLKERLKSREDY